jgi:hypothetical protein
MRIAKLAAALLLAAACSKTVKVETDPKTASVDVDVQKPGTAEGWKGTISAVGASGVNATATGTTASDMSMVTVNLTGGQAGATYPWHVHEGKCSDASPPIVSNPSEYPPLVVGAGGTATASAHVTVKLNEAKNYIINIHASPTNLGTIIACGDFND